ncbi:unnamed protein product [Sympodiomycopsis kandeliae]
MPSSISQQGNGQSGLRAPWAGLSPRTNDRQRRPIPSVTSASSSEASTSSASSSSSSASSSSSRTQKQFHTNKRHSMPIHSYPTESSSSNGGWWEEVLPSGKLADRLRRAHRSQTGTSGTSSSASSSRSYGPASASASPSGSAASTPKATLSPRFRSPKSRSEFSSPTISFPVQEDGHYSNVARGHSLSGANRLRAEQRRDRVQSLDELSSLWATEPVSSSSSRAVTQSLKAPGKQRQVPGEIAAAAESGDGSRLAELKSRGRHQSMLASAPCPSARSRLLHSDRLSTGRFSPLARTPEISSGSEDDDFHHTGSQSGLTRSQSTLASPSSFQTQTNEGSSTHSIRQQHHRRRVTRVVSRTVSANSTSMTEQDWAELLNLRVDGQRPRRAYDEESQGSQDAIEEVPCVRSRRVSFDLSTDHRKGMPNVRLGSEQHRRSHLHEQVLPSSSSPSIGQPLGSSVEELVASGSQHWFNTTSSATMHRRRSRALHRGSYPSGRSSVSVSAPVSRRNSFSQGPHFTAPEPGDEASRRRHPGSHADHHGTADTDLLSDLPVLRSLNAAHDQLAKTTSQALSLSRSLFTVPAPWLRPVLHFTLLWCVSGATLMALAGCLFASYMLTAWDDVSVTRREVRKQASEFGKWAHGTGTGLEDHHCSSTTGISNASGQSSRRGSADSFTSSVSYLASSTHSVALDASKIVFDRLVVSPLTLATKWPVAVAKSLKPCAVPTPAASRRNSFSERSGETSDSKESTSDDSGSGNDDDGDGGTTSGGTRRGARRSRGRSRSRSRGKHFRPQNLPPRPPLASLIPSMFLTIMLAVGAALVGGWAKRRGGNAAGSNSSGHSASHRGGSSTHAAAAATPVASPRIEYGSSSSPSSPFIFDTDAPYNCDTAATSPVGLGIAGQA